MSDVDAARDPIAQAQERLSLASNALAARHMDECLEHLRVAAELARYARYVVEAGR